MGLQLAISVPLSPGATRHIIPFYLWAKGLHRAITHPAPGQEKHTIVEHLFCRGGEDAKDAEVSDPSSDDVAACARLGFAAHQRYFKRGIWDRSPDYQAAQHYLGAALELLPPGDPLRVDVSFALGSIRMTADG
jgi:hypothetical protein